MAAVGAHHDAAGLGQAGDAEGAEEGVEQARVVGVLHVLHVELPVVGQRLGEAAQHPHRLAEHAADAPPHLRAQVLLDGRRLRGERGEHEAVEGGGPQLAGAVVGLAEGRRHPAPAVAALLERDADQVAAQVVGPRVVDALEVAARGPAVVERDEGPAVRAAVLEGVDLPVGAAHHDDRHLAHEGGAVVARAREIGLEAHVAPGRALEDAPQLGPVVRLVLVDPVRHPRERGVGPPAIGAGSAHGAAARITRTRASPRGRRAPWSAARAPARGRRTRSCS